MNKREIKEYERRKEKERKNVEKEENKKLKKAYGENFREIVNGIYDTLYGATGQIKLSHSNVRFKKTNVIQAVIKNRPTKRSKVQKIGNELSRFLKSKGLNGYIITACKFDIMWRNGLNTEIGNPINIYWAVNYDEEYNRMFNETNKFSDYVFYMLLNPRRGKKGGKGDLNDCLWYCINKTIEKYNPWNKPEQLKWFLNLKRNEKISIDRMEEIENKIKKVGINITGDYEYTSKLGKTNTINLILKDNHYSINHKVNQKVIGNINYKEKQIFMYEKKTRTGYDGESLFNDVSIDLKCKIMRYQTNYILVPKVNNKLTIQEEYNLYITLADKLKEASEGRLNLYLTGTIKNTALKLFDEMTKHITPEMILMDETRWLIESTTGAIVFNEQYTGQAYKYDIKSLYPSIYSNKHTMIPIKRGIFKVFTKKEFEELKFYPIGIYKCKIHKSEDDKINRLFRFNKFNKYTNISLNHAKKLGLIIDIIEDEENNALLYPRSHCLTGHEVFNSYCDFLFPLKEQKIEGAKLLLNIISGVIGEMDEKKVYVDETINKDFDLDDDLEITGLKPSNDETKTIIYTVNKEKTFKSSFARFKPFMLSKGREIITSYILPYNNICVKCNTDSMILNEKTNIKTGDKIGEMVSEGYYHNINVKNNAKEIIYHWVNNTSS